MSFKIKNQLFLSLNLLIAGFGLSFVNQNFWINTGAFLLSLGLIGLIISPVVFHIIKTQKTKILGLYLILFSVLNIARHFEDFYVLADLLDFLNSNFIIHKTQYLISIIIWLFVSILIWIFSIKTLNTDIGLIELINKNWTKVILVLIGILFLLELPIFNWHGDFVGQLHGHSFWNRWHIH
jgi:hypothetical protein